MKILIPINCVGMISYDPCRITKYITENIQNDLFLSYNYQKLHFKNKNILLVMRF